MQWGKNWKLKTPPGADKGGMKYPGFSLSYFLQSPFWAPHWWNVNRNQLSRKLGKCSLWGQAHWDLEYYGGISKCVALCTYKELELCHREGTLLMQESPVPQSLLMFKFLALKTPVSTWIGLPSQSQTHLCFPLLISVCTLTNGTCISSSLSMEANLDSDQLWTLCTSSKTLDFRPISRFLTFAQPHGSVCTSKFQFSFSESIGP